MQPAGETSLHRSVDAAFVPESVVEASLEELHKQIAAFGWGRPWSLWGLANASGWLDDPLPLGAEAVAVVPLVDEGWQHPYEQLFGFDAPTEVFGVILCTEGWAVETGEMPAAALTTEELIDAVPGSPRRLCEMRCLIAVLADGRTYSQFRFRDGNVVYPHEGGLDGRVVNVLRRSLAAPCPVGPRHEALHAAHLIFVAGLVGAGMVEAGVSAESLVALSDPTLHQVVDLGRTADAQSTSGEWLDDDIWVELDLAASIMAVLATLLDPEIAAWAGPDLGSQWVLDNLDVAAARSQLADRQPELLSRLDDVYALRAAQRS